MAQSRLVLGAGVEHLASIGSRARRCIPRARSLRAVTALAVLATAAPAVGAPRPNVLLVVVDRLRADHLGAYGYGRATSPRLDALAASGVRFAQARATSSWTAPSVAAILTGLYPLRHGLQLPSTSLQPTTPVLAESFAAAGYATAALSANAAYVTSRQGFARGFDEFRVLHGGPSRDEQDTDVMPEGPAAGGMVKVANARVITDAALAWVARAGAERPFLLYVHFE